MAVAIVMAAISAWYYAHGSLSLDFIAPNIEDALRSSLTQANVKFDDISIRQSSDGELASISVNNLTVKSSRGNANAFFPEAELTFKFTSLLQGKIRPKKIVVKQGTLTTSSLEDPAPPIRKSKRKKEADKKPVKPTTRLSWQDQLAPLIQPFFPEETEADSLFSTLETAEIKTLTWLRDDGQTGEGLAQFSAVFNQSDKQIRMKLDGQFAADNETPITFHIDGTRFKSQELAHWTFSSSIIDLNKLANLVGQEIFSERINLPFEVSGQTAFDKNGGVVNAEFNAQIIDGYIDLEGLTLANNPEPDPNNPLDALQPQRELPMLEKIGVQTGRLTLNYDAETQTVDIDRLYLSADENQLNWSGKIDLNPQNNINPESLDEPSKEKTWGIPNFAFELDGLETRIKIAGIFPELTVIEQIKLAGKLDENGKTLSVDNLNILIDGGELKFSGSIDNLLLAGQPAGNPSPGSDQIQAPGITADATLEKIKIATVIKLWPAFVGLGARDWIDNYVTKGHVTTGTLAIAIPANFLGSGPLDNDMLDLSFKFADGEAHYIPGLTPVRNAAGSAKLSGNKFELYVPKANVENIILTDGSVVMPRLVPKGSVSKFSATLYGDTQEILKLIDMKPLRLMERFGMDPERSGGQAEVQFTIGRPNRRYIPVEMIEYEATASSENLSLSNVIGELGLSHGDVDLSITKAGIKGDANIRLGGLPVHLDWREVFNAAPNSSTFYKITFNEDVSDFSKLGFDLQEMLSGSIKGAIETSGDGPVFHTAKVDLDLTNVQIDLPQFEWRKIHGQAGRLQVSGQLPKNKTSNSNWTIALSSDEAQIDGSLKLASNFRLIEAAFPRVKIGRQNDLSLYAERRKRDKGLEIKLYGNSLTAGELIENYTSGGSSQFDVPIEFRSTLDKVFLKKGVLLEQTKLNLEIDSGKLVAFDLDANFPGGGGVYGALTEFEWGDRQLVFSATDTGKVISGITGSSSFFGGEMDMVMAFPIRQDTPANGTINVQEFRIINLPLLARLLSAGSLQGMSDLLNGEGLAFKQMEIAFKSSDGQLTIDKAHASGPALGVTAAGYFDQEQSRIGLHGTIVPIYAVNRIFGYLPLIGNVFTSREGEGLLGFTYQVKGPLDQAQISVNPLSVIAPGFLRRLFQLGNNDKRPPKETDEDDDRDPSTLQELEATKPDKNKNLEPQSNRLNGRPGRPKSQL